MRVLLIDADVVSYEAACAVEKAFEFEPGYWTWSCDFNEVQRVFDDKITKLMDELKGDKAVLCLTDRERNWRLDVLPTYKGNRKAVKKPLVLKPLTEWLIEERGAYFRPRLEGDDIMGILSTRSNPEREERIIVSIDKDMKTIPGLFSKDGKKIVEVTEEEADYQHLYQTLIGDTTDGYTGCPGIGPVKAKAILADPSWDAVVATYEKAKLNEEVALQQARVARILRASDYNFKTKEPILWQPK